MCDWILEAIGPDHPLHFSAFHPDYRMLDRPPTPHATLIAAYDIASRAGLRFVYVGNVDDKQRQSTYCPSCRQLLIERNWYALGSYQLRGNRCGHCGTVIPGRFGDQPGDWGRRRARVDISRFDQDLSRGTRYRRSPWRRRRTTRSTLGGSYDRSPVNASATPGLPRCSPSCADPHNIGRFMRLPAKWSRQRWNSAVAPGRLPAKDVADVHCTERTSVSNGRGDCAAVADFIGRLTPVVDAMADAAQRTANEDPRFPPVSIDGTAVPGAGDLVTGASATDDQPRC